MKAEPALILRTRQTCRQRLRRCRSRRLPLRSAVRRAVDVFFRFQYRNDRFKALWCGTEHVWMGRETFLHWALSDLDIDIPWVVATAPDAPPKAGDLLQVVRVELTAYWADQTASLPEIGQPRWLPLP